MDPTSGYAFVGLENLHNDIYPLIDASTNKDLNQSGKVVLITGAGRGIGRAIALQYAHASVASIILCARTVPELDEVEASIKKINSSVKVTKFQLDVTNEDAVKACLDAVKKDEGRLNVLVNNAGTTEPWVPIGESKPSNWWNTFEVNLKGPYLLMQAFLPLLVETAKADGTTVDVVNISSIGALIVHPGVSAYQVSKLAVQRLTEFAAAEYGKLGVNVVGLHPGGVLTALSEGIASIREYMVDTPELCGGFTVWLTKGARTWLEGRYLSSTWDVTKLESMREEIVAGDKLKVKMVI
ncbi:putative oxidoreductase ucpA [Melanomma pulvis-pyrius CBS 109.77]|uniref:Putative oxidoreductase ucpA n=1 Tax=Melanomma pulvis-pyrius CBS 109.77 TaxID=1314802 RepID=A0A6A6XDS2_9PLEO|nr:putative oxidoreductase ucpA [Melanomma pulvis-pyrius CBS 109.77]